VEKYWSEKNNTRGLNRKFELAEKRFKDIEETLIMKSEHQREKQSHSNSEKNKHNGVQRNIAQNSKFDENC
jgi:hypothetical protein